MTKYNIVLDLGFSKDYEILFDKFSYGKGFCVKDKNNKFFVLISLRDGGFVSIASSCSVYHIGYHWKSKDKLCAWLNDNMFTIYPINEMDIKISI